ncbi:MAG: DUF4340 domain-containing protein [Gemmatimonadota bacterium]|nr:DUF4340 domain-containing protein [Gemmatimonadota bacterium]
MTPDVLRRIAVVLGVALALWGAGYMWRQGHRDEPGTLRLPPVDTASVEEIALRRPTDTLVARRAPGGWTVNGFPASAEQVAKLLAAYADSSIRTELVAESPASHARLGVDSAAGRRFTIAAGGTVVADFVLGNRGPDFEGTYLRARSDSAVYLLHGEITDVFLDALDAWREKRIVAVPAESIAAVEVAVGRASWRLARQDGRWVSGGASADSVKVRRYLGQFEGLRASGFPDPALDPPRFEPLARTVSVLGGAGAVLARLEFVDAGGGAFWVREAGQGVVYRLPSATVDLIAPARPDLLP